MMMCPSEETAQVTPKPHSELVETIRVGLGVFRNLENGDARNAYDALNELVEQLEAAQEKLGWYERTQWIRRLKEERDRADAATVALSDIATREWRDEGGRIAAAIARDGLSARDGLPVTKPADPPITKERPRDAGTSGATT